MIDGIVLSWFAAVSSLIVLIYVVVFQAKDPVVERLGKLNRGASDAKRTASQFPADGRRPLDNVARRPPRREKQKILLKDRLAHAGLYAPWTARWLQMLRWGLLVVPVGLGLVAGQAGYLPVSRGIFFGAVAGIAGTLVPSFWLDRVKSSRQTKIRRSLPDAVDVLVVCLEGGLSLTGALSRVARELATAHPMLAIEVNIVERQIQMGHSAGQAMRDFASRFDLEELRNLSSVLVHSEKVGASIAGALVVFAESLRVRRRQKAEEMGQKAIVKMIFPTVFFIFPAIFIVILGPAAIQIYDTLIQGIVRGH